MKVYIPFVDSNFTFMDEFSGTGLSHGDLDASGSPTHSSYEIVAHPWNMTERSIPGDILAAGNQTVPSVFVLDEEYTQTVSIIAFSSLVLFAILAYVFSKHCFFKEKPTTAGPTTASQFSFIGTQRVRGIIATNASNRNDEPPPAYDELFPPDFVIVESRNIASPSSEAKVNPPPPPPPDFKEEKPTD